MLIYFTNHLPSAVIPSACNTHTDIINNVLNDRSVAAYLFSANDDDDNSYVYACEILLSTCISIINRQT